MICRVGGAVFGATARRARRPSADRYLVSVCAVAAIALLVAGVAGGSAIIDPDAALFTAALTLCAPAPLLTRWRADSIALTVDEVFLLPALVVLPPAVVIVVAAVGTALGLTLGQRWSAGRVRGRYFAARRTVFNVAQKTLAASAAALVVAALGPEPSPLVGAIAAAAAGAVIYGLTSRLLVAGMIARLRPATFRTVVTDDIDAFLVISSVVWGVGAMLAVAVATLPAPWVWVAITVALVLVGSTLTNRVARQRERLSALLAAASRVQRAGPDVTEVEEALTDSARALLSCGHAWLERVPPADGEFAAEVVPGIWHYADDPLTSYYARFDEDDRSVLDTLASMAAPAVEHATAMRSLRAADDMKAAVLASVSHDLRTPLATASGIASLLADDADLSADERRLLTGQLTGAIDRVTGLVAMLLDLERYELGRLPEPADADIGVSIGRVVSALSGEDAAPVVVDGTPSRARIDATTLERVVENLLTNAVKHTPPGEVVTVSYRTDGDDVVITVDDAGPGVEPGDRDAIFEPFRHGGGAGSVGLGLWVARRFVELRDGRIDVERSPAGGASFRVRLPSVRSASDVA